MFEVPGITIRKKQSATTGKLAEILKASAASRGDLMTPYDLGRYVGRHIKQAEDRSTSLPMYHLVDRKHVPLVRKHGLMTPMAMYEAGRMDLFDESVDKYRDRLTGAWGIYPGRKPEDLTREETIKGLDEFREAKRFGDGLRYLYAFRHPPHKGLGPNMAKVLKAKQILEFSLDTNDPNVKKVYWGYEGVHPYGKRLRRSYYDSVTPEDYFKDYDDDPERGPIFGSINHPAIHLRDGVFPLDTFKGLQTRVSTFDRLKQLTKQSATAGKKESAPVKPKKITQKAFYPHWRALEQYADELIGGPPTATDSAAYREWLKGKSELRLRGINNDAVIAMSPFDDALAVHSLYVAPEMRGRGYGKRLLEDALEHARAKQYARIRLGTPKENVRAKEFYLREGFNLVDNKEYPDSYAFDMPVETQARIPGITMVREKRAATAPKLASVVRRHTRRKGYCWVDRG